MLVVFHMERATNVRENAMFEETTEERRNTIVWSVQKSVGSIYENHCDPAQLAYTYIFSPQRAEEKNVIIIIILNNNYI